MESGATQRVLIAGGSSGLGLELGKLLSAMSSVQNVVTVTGRINPKEAGIDFQYLDLGECNRISDSLDDLLRHSQRIDLLIYAAGYYQEGKIDELSDSDILKMSMVGLTTPAMLVKRILAQQDALPGFIAITSTSSWTPRLYEPVYSATKAGLTMLARSISLDPRVGQTLVVGPSGMKTRFWQDTAKDTSTMMDPSWVAQKIIELYYLEKYVFRFAKVLGSPPRVETVETVTSR